MIRRTLFILLLFPLLAFAETHKQVIIYLNGSSSVGKTTLAHHLQKQAPFPLLYIGLDWIIDMMPPQSNDFFAEKNESLPGFRWVPKEETFPKEVDHMVVGPLGESMLALYRSLARELAAQGISFVIDDVALGKEQVDLWREALTGYPVLFVGLTAPYEVIEARERARGDRLLGIAKKLVGQCHTGVDYDLMLDTHAQSLDENCATIFTKLAEVPAS